MTWATPWRAEPLEGSPAWRILAPGDDGKEHKVGEIMLSVDNGPLLPELLAAAARRFGSR